MTSVYKDKTVNRFEVRSKTDNEPFLRIRNNELDTQIRQQGYNPEPTKVIEIRSYDYGK